MEISTAPVDESLEVIKKLKVEELKNILRDRGQRVTGQKADLVLRCHVLFERQKTPTNGLPEQENVPLLPVTSSKKSADIMYKSVMAKAVDCVWATNLRGPPPFNFVQLYDCHQNSKIRPHFNSQVRIQKIESFSVLQRGSHNEDTH